MECLIGGVWLWTGVDGGFRGGWWWLWWSCSGEQDEEGKTWMGEEAILSLSFSDQLGHGSLVRETKAEIRERKMAVFLDSIISLSLFLLFYF